MWHARSAPLPWTDLDGSTRTKPGQQAGHVTVSASPRRSLFDGRRLHQLGRGVVLAYAPRGRLASITTLPGRTFAVCSREVLERGQPPSVERSASQHFGGHWQRHIERCSCLSKGFTPTKKSLKITSPVSMTKPYFVSECRVAGFVRTLLSGLARSIKTM